MDVAESRRAKDVESLKSQLKNAKQQIEETVKKTENLKNDLKEGKLQFSKTLCNMQKIQSSQALKIAKLNADIKNFENMCLNQTTEQNNFIDSIKTLNEEFETLTRESERKIAENQKLCLDLDKDVKCQFVKCQSDQEMVVLWELGQSLSSEEEEQAFKKIFFKIKAEADKRFDSFKQELTLMDEALMRLREEIREKRERFNLAQAKYFTLRSMPQEAHPDKRMNESDDV